VALTRLGSIAADAIGGNAVALDTTKKGTSRVTSATS